MSTISTTSHHLPRNHQPHLRGQGPAREVGYTHRNVRKAQVDPDTPSHQGAQQQGDDTGVLPRHARGNERATEGQTEPK